MNAHSIPWLELTVLVPFFGGLVALRSRNSLSGPHIGFVFTAATLACSVMAWFRFQSAVAFAGGSYRGLQPTILGHPLLAIDELSAPLLPLVALLHFLTVVATTGSKSSRFSFSGLLISESIRLAIFAATPDQPWYLIILLALATIPPYFELKQRAKPTRVYVLHMSLFAVLLILGWAFVEDDLPIHLQPALACFPLLMAVLIRSGTVPAHLWIADLFENASFGTGLLFLTPIAGIYAAVRLVMPICPDWVLRSIALLSLATGLYAAGLAIVQTEARRFFVYLFLSHTSLVLVGLEMRTAISLTGALSLWFSAALSLAGLGLSLRAVEARFGRLSMTQFRGLYGQSPALAICFLLTGLGSVGFPGTMGFIATEMLVSGAVGADLPIGATLVIVSALNGIAVVRAYFLIFTGGRHVSALPLGITRRERFAVLTLAALILGGGLAPQYGLESRYRAAEAMLEQRERQAISHSSAGESTHPENELPTERK